MCAQKCRNFSPFSLCFKYDIDYKIYEKSKDLSRIATRILGFNRLLIDLHKLISFWWDCLPNHILKQPKICCVWLKIHRQHRNWRGIWEANNTHTKTNLLIVFARPNNKYVCCNYLSKKKLGQVKALINIYKHYKLTESGSITYCELCFLYLLDIFCTLTILLLRLKHFLSSDSRNSFRLVLISTPFSELRFSFYVHWHYYFAVINKPHVKDFQQALELFAMCFHLQMPIRANPTNKFIPSPISCGTHALNLKWSW